MIPERYYRTFGSLTTLHNLFLSFICKGVVFAGELLMLLKIALMKSTASSSKLKYYTKVLGESYMLR